VCVCVYIYIYIMQMCIHAQEMLYTTIVSTYAWPCCLCPKEVVQKRTKKRRRKIRYDCEDTYAYACLCAENANQFFFVKSRTRNSIHDYYEYIYVYIHTWIHEST
jgi:hypothetical protein